MSNVDQKEASFLAITPLIVFLVLYLGVSILLNDFYKVPIAVAFLISSIYAVAITRKERLQKRVEIFSKGAANPTLLMMVWIFMLAGAFAKCAKEMGAVDATVFATLKLLPSSFLLPGLFIAACLISLSIGTSVGTIAALVPMAMGITEQTDLPLAMVVAIVVGGAYFGDNLSFISDTTIIATKSQGCEMSDKFKVNCYLAVPAALLMLVYYSVIGMNVGVLDTISDVAWVKIIPYVFVLVLAVLGVDVMLVLFIGILLTGIVGISTGSYDFFGWLASMNEGVMGMGELIIVTLLSGGMLELIRYNGGMTYLTRLLTAGVKTKKGGELCIASLSVLCDICTANNTIAIITAGPIAKEISERYSIDSRKSASLLDTFSCFAQGLIPYGAQMLIAAGIAAVSPVEILIYLYYPMVLGAISIISILLRYPRKYS